MTLTHGRGEDWLSYFDGLETSPLHRAQAAHYVRSLAADVGLTRTHRVLDLGSGAGTVVALIAPRVAEVWWWDPAPGMRSGAERLTRGVPNARFCDLDRPIEAPPRAVPGAPFDLILVNSVVQYMPQEELWAWLPRWRAMLTTDGRVVLSDLIPPSHAPHSDVLDLLRFGSRHASPWRVFGQALGDVRRYRHVSRSAPLVRTGVEDLVRHATRAGLEVEVLPRNLTHLRTRWTAILRQRSPAEPSP